MTFRWISLLKSVYSIVLVIFGVEAITLARLNYIKFCAEAYNPFTLPNVALFALLIATILSARSPAWLWLGAPSMCYILGFHLFIFLAVLLRLHA
jgi:hypothetical protein